MKILYAAGNTISSRYQLQRFISHIPNHTKYKISAFVKSSPDHQSINWTLDCLLNPREKEKPLFHNNENFSIYYDCIKDYRPDLILSDLELFSSTIAIDLGIPLIQCSTNLLSFGLTEMAKKNLGVFNTYGSLFQNRDLNEIINNITFNSEENYIYSHFGDLDFAPELKSNFKWASPYHEVGVHNLICEHEIVAVTPANVPAIINEMKAYSDCVLFNHSSNIAYNNVEVKNIENNKEYYCNIKNAKNLFCESNATFLADAFYNKKFPIFSMDVFDKDSVLNGIATLHFSLGKDIKNQNKNMCFKKQEHVRKNLFIHQILESLDI